MKKILALLITMFFLGTLAAAQTPTDALKAFYKFHRTRSGAFNAVEVKAHASFFSADLNRLFQYELKREREFLKKNPSDKPYYGDGMPFLPLEECVVKGRVMPSVMSYSNERIAGDKATVTVRFNEPKACGGKRVAAFTFTLVRVGARWLIDDFDDGDHTLKGDLNRPTYGD